VRRRPLLRAAAVGGTFAAGRAAGRRMAAQDTSRAAQDQHFGSAGDQQPQHGMPAHGVPAQGSPASVEASMMDQLSQLSMLHEQGALTDDEFAAAKAKVLGG
jgi:hypothetical protein